MKRIAQLLAVVLLATGVAGETAAQRKTETVIFETSIHCNNCRARIEDSIPFERGVKSVDVDVAEKTVTVTYDPSKTDVATLKKAINDLGYDAEPIAPASGEPSADGSTGATVIN